MTNVAFSNLTGPEWAYVYVCEQCHAKQPVFLCLHQSYNNTYQILWQYKKYFFLKTLPINLFHQKYYCYIITNNGALCFCAFLLAGIGQWILVWDRIAYPQKKILESFSYPLNDLVMPQVWFVVESKTLVISPHWLLLLSKVPFNIKRMNVKIEVSIWTRILMTWSFAQWL